MVESIGERDKTVKSKGQFYTEGKKRASLVRSFPGLARSSFWQQQYKDENEMCEEDRMVTVVLWNRGREILIYE